jgi:ABC-type Mn2+/Zn2+ transport system ATPase subunit
MRVSRVTANHPATAITINDLTVCYGVTDAVRNVTCTLKYGEITAIIGPNGSGKSTVLAAISGLISPTHGSITMHDPATKSAHVAHVLQSTIANEALPLTVYETVRMGAFARHGLFGRITKTDKQHIEQTLERLDLAALRNRPLHALSGGQRQRVYLAQALAEQASILLLDEPITGLDIISQDVIQRTIREERNAGTCVVLTTHDLETARNCDQVLLLATDVIRCGTPEDALDVTALQEAFGGHLHALPDGTLILDDPHPHHPTHGTAGG